MDTQPPKELTDLSIVSGGLLYPLLATHPPVRR